MSFRCAKIVNYNDFRHHTRPKITFQTYLYAFFDSIDLLFENYRYLCLPTIILRIMNNYCKIISRLMVSVVCVAAIWSCGDSDSFTIEGTVDGNATLNLRFIYYTNGSLVKGLTAARDGKFEYKGVALNPCVVEILDNDFRPMGRVYVSNGDRIECHLTRNAPEKIQVSGNEISERWAKFLNDNADRLTSAGGNDAIEEYVRKNPSDIVSTLLMLTSYDASSDALRADSIMSSINPEMRPSLLVDNFNSLLQRLVSSVSTDTIAPISCLNMRDSLVDFNPSAKALSLIVISDASSGRSDSIVPVLGRLYRRSSRPSLQLADISVDKDTMSWHKSVRPDSASWPQLWVAGSLASPGIDRLGVPALPYFIVTDSAGVQLLRTPSVKRAEAFVDSCINSKNR